MIEIDLGGTMKPSTKNAVLGAIIGDYVGSRFEFNNHRSKFFKFFHKDCRFTDDTVMTVAVHDALANGTHRDIRDNVIESMRKYGRLYPNAGYGRMFKEWINSDDYYSYGSTGNGALMRVSPVIINFSDYLSKSVAVIVTKVTHDSNQAISAVSLFINILNMINSGYTKCDIKKFASDKYPIIDTNLSLKYISTFNKFDESCDGTLPLAIMCFLNSSGFEDAIRNAISIGGDSDTIANITGAMAGIYYHIPDRFIDHIRNEMSTKYPDLYEVMEPVFNM